MILQHTVLRDGSTWAARAWTCVAGHNIVPRAQQTNFSSACRHSTRTARSEHTSRGNTAERITWRVHTSWTQSKVQLCCQKHAWPTNTRAQGTSWHRTSLSEVGAGLKLVQSLSNSAHVGSWLEVVVGLKEFVCPRHRD